MRIKGCLKRDTNSVGEISDADDNQREPLSLGELAHL